MISAQDSTKAIHPRRRRGERLYVTLTANEKAIVTHAADSAEISAAEWARTILLREAKRATRLASKAASVSDEEPGHLP